MLKIDRSFTAALGEDHQGASIAGAIVSLAQALGLATVAEGIEDRRAARRLERLGCTLGQGFLFARPQPPAAFDDVLRAERALSRRRAARSITRSAQAREGPHARREVASGDGVLLARVADAAARSGRTASRPGRRRSRPPPRRAARR